MNSLTSSKHWGSTKETFALHGKEKKSQAVRKTKLPTSREHGCDDVRIAGRRPQSSFTPEPTTRHEIWGTRHTWTLCEVWVYKKDISLCFTHTHTHMYMHNPFFILSHLASDILWINLFNTFLPSLVSLCAHSLTFCVTLCTISLYLTLYVYFSATISLPVFLSLFNTYYFHWWTLNTSNLFISQHILFTVTSYINPHLCTYRIFSLLWF